MFPFCLPSALKNRRERRSGRVPQPAVQARRTRLTLDLEPLEDRCLMSAGLIDPPTPIGPTMAFAVGIGPGMQIDFFETDRAGQVFAQPVMNLFMHAGPTVFINSQVQIPVTIPQSDGPPVVGIKDQDGQLFPGLWINPFDSVATAPVISGIAGPIFGQVFGPTVGQAVHNAIDQAVGVETFTGDIGFSFIGYDHTPNGLFPSVQATDTGGGDVPLSLTMVRGPDGLWRLSSATATLFQHPGPVTVKGPFGEPEQIDLSGHWVGHPNDGLTGESPDGIPSLTDGQPYAFLLTQLDQNGDPNGGDLIVAGRFNNGQFTGTVVNPGQELRYVQQAIEGTTLVGSYGPPPYWTTDGVTPYSIIDGTALRPNGVQLQQVP